MYDNQTRYIQAWQVIVTLLCAAEQVGVAVSIPLAACMAA